MSKRYHNPCAIHFPLINIITTYYSHLSLSPPSVPFSQLSDMCFQAISFLY
ncbi:hypothetical protein OROHE_010528 [Orobanche hederae]